MTYKLEEFKRWLEADPSRKDYASSHSQRWSEQTFEHLAQGDNWEKVLRDEYPTFAFYQKHTIFQWKKEVDAERERERAEIRSSKGTSIAWKAREQFTLS